jgi:hypothetical protein
VGTGAPSYRGFRYPVEIISHGARKLGAASWCVLFLQCLGVDHRRQKSTFLSF